MYKNIKYQSKYLEAATGDVVKKGVLRNFAKVTGKHLCQSLFFNKVALVSFCEFCEIFKNTFFTGHNLETASEKITFSLTLFDIRNHFMVQADVT